MAVIRNPIEWSWDQFKLAASAVGSIGHALHGAEHNDYVSAPAVRRIRIADLKDALIQGFDDFGAYRTDVLFLCVFYPVAGLVLAHLTFGYNLVPLLFPLAAGFTLLGPVAAVGLYEMSRRREQGVKASWADAFGIVRSPSYGAIVVLGLALLVLFLFWLLAADGIYQLTLGPQPPASTGAFVRAVLTTGAGWTMIIIGFGVGFLFAVAALVISVVSFPLLLDRDVGLAAAVWTSIRAVTANPVPMAIWGLIVAFSLAIGSIPLFVGLIVVMPVLGHATWHLYRKLVPR